VQPDPLLNDGAEISVRGVSVSLKSTPQVPYNGDTVADAMGRLTADKLTPKTYSAGPMLSGGPSLYGYAQQAPLTRSDRSGLEVVVAGLYTQRPSRNPSINSCNVSCDDTFSHDLDVCDTLYPGGRGFLGGECSKSAWARHGQCTNGEEMQPLLHFIQ
jgi:hypothetical protein